MKMTSSIGALHIFHVVCLCLLSMCESSTYVPCFNGCKCKDSDQYSIICHSSLRTVLPESIPREIDIMEFFDVPRLNIDGLHTWKGNVRYLGIRRCGIKDPLLLPSGLQELSLENTDINETLLEQCLSQSNAKLLLGLSISQSPITITKKMQHVFDTTPFLLFLSLSEIHIPVLLKELFQKASVLRRLEIRNCSVKAIEGGAITQLSKLRYLSLMGNKLVSLANTSFQFPINLLQLDMSSNLLTSFPVITGPKVLMILNLSCNSINSMENLAHSSFKFVNTMLLSQNKIKDIRSNMIGNCSFGFLLDLSSNELTTIRSSLLNYAKRATILNLGENKISTLSPFHSMQRLSSLYLYKNNLSSVEGNIFNGTSLKVLLLHSNKIRTLGKPFTGLKESLKLLTLFANPLQSIDAITYSDLKADAEVGLCFDSVKYINSSDSTSIRFTCPRFMNFVLPKVDYSLSRSLLRQGFECDSNLTPDGAGRCSACPPGQFNKGWIGCRMCPRGGFYQDEAAQTYCKRCNKGQFVNYEGGSSSSNCITCPFGTDPNQYADTRACYCLAGFSRNDRFGPCSACSASSLVCRNESRELAKGFWWHWDKNSRREYDCFRKNLLTKGEDYNTECNSFTKRLPRRHRCLSLQACLGGINATCHPFYTGPLCAVCREGYYKSGPHCFKCLDRFYAIIGLLGTVCFVFLTIFIIYKLSGITLKASPSRTYGDVIISIWKIVLTFYQLIPIIVSLLSVLNWPEVIVTVASKLHSFMVQVLSLQFLTCLFQHLTISAYKELVISLGFMATVFIIPFAFLLIQICNIRRKRETWINEGTKSACHTCVKNIILVMFIIYPGLCQRIFQTLPFTCHKICVDYEKRNCTSYLRVDYSSKCPESDASNFVYVKLAYCMLPIPFLFPAVLLGLLWYEHKKRKSTLWGNGNIENSSMTRFLYENYHDKYWFWEIIELLKKLLYSVGFAFFGFNTKTNIGYLIVISGLFLVLYTYIKPVKYSLEHYLQTISLSCIFLTVCIAVLLDVRLSGNSGHLQGKKDKLGIKVILLTVISFPLLCILIRVFCVLTYKIWWKVKTFITKTDRF